MSERVDKAWHTKGIDAYSTAAIIGTLNHYGVQVSEERFKELAKDDFPLAIAQSWHQSWKGTGQFTRFPAAAAEELWRRLCAGEVAPTDVSLALVNLLTTMNHALEQKPDDGTWNTRFAVCEAYLPKVPPPGDRREKFMAEMVAALGEWLEVFDRMGEALAKKGHPALADRFVALEEQLFPVREGAARALVRAAKGDTEGAAADLLAVASDTKRDDFSRISAVDGLIDLDRLADAKRIALELVDKAEADKDLELGTEIVQRFTRLLEKDPKMPDKHELRARVEKLAAALKPSGE